jgi:hypothetical protein
MSFIELCLEGNVEEVKKIVAKDNKEKGQNFEYYENAGTIDNKEKGSIFEYYKNAGTINEKNKNDFNALHKIIQKIHNDEEERLLFDKPKKSDDNLMTIIDLIVKSDNFEGLNSCGQLKTWANNKYYVTPFYLACEYGLYDIAKTISECKKFYSLDISCHPRHPYESEKDLDEDPYLPIDIAAYNDHAAIVKLILDHSDFTESQIVKWKPERTLKFAEKHENIVNIIKEHPKYISRPDLVKKFEEQKQKKEEKEKLIRDKKNRCDHVEKTGCYNKEIDLPNVDLEFIYYETQSIFTADETKFRYRYNGCNKKIFEHTPKRFGNCDLTSADLIEKLNKVSKEGYNIRMTVRYYYDNDQRDFQELKNGNVAKQILNDLLPENELVSKCLITIALSLGFYSKTVLLLQWDKQN